MKFIPTYFLGTEKLSRPPYLLSKKEVQKLNNRRAKDLAPRVDTAYNNRVYAEICKYVSTLSPGRQLNILDFGCGEGQFGEWLWTHCRKGDFALYGVDIRDIKSRSLDRYYRSFRHINYSQGAPFQPQVTFDVSVCLFVFHFKIYESQLRDIWSSLAPGGTLLFNSLSYTPPVVHEKLREVGFVQKWVRQIPRKNSRHSLFCYEKPLVQSA